MSTIDPTREHARLLLHADAIEADLEPLAAGDVAARARVAELEAALPGLGGGAPEDLATSLRRFLHDLRGHEQAECSLLQGTLTRDAGTVD